HILDAPVRIERDRSEIARRLAASDVPGLGCRFGRSRNRIRRGGAPVAVLLRRRRFALLLGATGWSRALELLEAEFVILLHLAELLLQLQQEEIQFLHLPGQAADLLLQRLDARIGGLGDKPLPRRGTDGASADPGRR